MARTSRQFRDFTIHFGWHEFLKLFQPNPCVLNYRIPLFAFLIIEVQHLMPENIVGQLGLDCFDSTLAQVSFFRAAGLCHHVNMRMVGLVVECRIPAEVIRRYFHGGGNLIAVGTKQAPPCDFEYSCQLHSLP